MLPDLPYRSGKVYSQLLEFRGLNLSENYTDGEFVDSSNLSTRQYPCITQRRGLETLDGYVGPTDVFEWDGKLIVVDGTDLKYNGEKVGQVTPGKKQFAVVNTKLVVWPDMMILDLVTSKFEMMQKSITGAVNTAVFTEDTITMNREPAKVVEDLSTYYDLYSFQDATFHKYQGLVLQFKTYSDITWENGAIVATGEKTKGFGNELYGYRRLFPDGILQVGDLIRISSSRVYGNYSANYRRYYCIEGAEDRIEVDYAENDPYFYAKITSVDNHFEQQEGYEAYDNYGRYHAEIWDARQGTAVFDTVFSVGDIVEIIGCTTYPENNTDSAYLKISGVTDSSVTFSGASFTSGNEAGAVMIRVPIPHLDFICESENRLWGVSNATENVIIENGEVKSFTSRCIYASALGLPTHFWDFDGVDTDSYQVAVGSEGDFTGICNYNGVNCWKEKKLHRVYGSYPSEYYIGEYDIPGVANGSSHSLQIINEVLYYHGIYGIYAYNGNTPTMISYKLGAAPLTDAISGTDGERLFIFAKRAGVGTLFTYDTLHGLWLKDTLSGVTGFCSVGGKLYICAQGEIKSFTDLATEQFEWSVTFVPFFANVNANASTVSSFNKKNFTRIHLRADMQLGSTLNVYVKYDNGEWKKVYTKEADSDVIIKVPIPISRCDHIQIKLDGTNGVTIRGMEREFSRASHE